jgi:hypothetical protein
MASKRDLKKMVNAMVFDVVEEAFNVQLYDPKKEDASEKFIDSVADFHENMLTRINQANTKAEFRQIRADIEQQAVDFIQDVNNMY